MMNRRILLISAALWFACGGGQKPSEGPANPCADNPCAPGAAEKAPAAPAGEGGDYSTWQSWTRVSAAVFVSKGHSDKPAHVYVEGEHAAWYRALAEGQKAPVGFKVTKVHYKAMDGAEVDNMLVMTKMEPGYDPDNGDWFYAIYDATGTTARMAGKLDGCINCHAGSADTDFLGGLPQ